MTARKPATPSAPAEGVAFTHEAATAYLRARDSSVKRWHRMKAAELITLIEALNDQGWLFGGPDTWSHDERVNHLAAETYPRADEAREVYLRGVGK